MVKSNTYTNTSFVYETKLNIPLEYKEKCIDALYNLKTHPVAPRDKSFEDTFDEQNSGQVVISNYNLVVEAPILKKLLDNITKIIKHHVFPNYLEDQWDLNMASCWGGIYEKNGKALSHNHIPFYYSFVYYLKTSDQSSPMIFEGNDNLSISVRDDLLLFFSSGQYHHVPPNKGEDRIFIAGNMELNQK